MTNSKHPFERIFEKALKKSSHDDNLVYKEAHALRTKGYRSEEILTVLTKLQKALIDDNEALLVQDAIDIFER